MVSTVVNIDDALGAILGLETEVARATTRPAPVRAVTCIMDKRRPRMIIQSSVPLGASVEADKPQILALFEDDEPCIMGVKIGADLSKWAMIAWVPDSVTAPRRKVYQKNAIQLAEQMKPKVMKKITASTKVEVQDFLAKVEEDLGSASGTFIRANTMFTEVEMPTADSKEERNDDFHSPREGEDDLRAEVRSLRAGLIAVQKECATLHGLFDTEMNMITGGKPETTDLEERVDKIEKAQGETQTRLDEDLTVLKGLKQDFDGLVAILDEELTALEEKSERSGGGGGGNNRISQRSGQSEFIPKLSQAVRKSIATQQMGVSPLLQQEIDELKERMDDSEKGHEELQSGSVELRGLVDKDQSTLNTLKSDFDGLVAILDEELTALNEKTEKGQNSEFIPRISQAVRKSQLASLQPITILQQDVDELKERMDDAEKVHTQLQEQLAKK